MTSALIFANSAKHARFGSLLLVSSCVISTSAMLLAFSIIPEFMHSIEPDFFQYLSHCQCCEDVAYCQRQKFPEFLLTLCVEWWGVGDYTTRLRIIRKPTEMHIICETRNDPNSVERRWIPFLKQTLYATLKDLGLKNHICEPLFMFYSLSCIIGACVCFCCFLSCA